MGQHTENVELVQHHRTAEGPREWFVRIHRADISVAEESPRRAPMAWSALRQASLQGQTDFDLAASMYLGPWYGGQPAAWKSAIRDGFAHAW